MGQQVLNGIFLGSIYALFAVGYTLVFGVLDILNLAHQAVFMLAAFVALALVADAHLSLWVALPLAVVAGGLIGIVLERLAFRPASAGLGRSLRAVGPRPRAARILSLSVDRAIAMAFFLSSALAGAAGVLFGLAFNSISPDVGRGVELKGLAVIILGGMGSTP